MPEPRFQFLARHGDMMPVFGRLTLTVLALTAVLAVGFWVGSAEAHPSLGAALQAAQDYNTLRVHGYPVVSNPNERAFGNRPATAGSNAATDPNTGQIAEDPPYSDLSGPFDPHSAEAPEMDFVTWDPVWISERLADATLRAAWPSLTGVDEVSQAARIRAGSIDASEKVWLRHWYEPQHLDKDLNADGRLTDADNNGTPDAPVNPAATSVDEWYPAIMTELTYMLVENDPLPMANPTADQLYRSAPRPVCGRTGGTEFIFPTGVDQSELDPAGPAVGYGLTRLDADFDDDIDSVRVADEASLPTEIGGARIDFDGDGVLDTVDSDGAALSCDELVVFHTDSLTVGVGEEIQFLDHFVRLVSLTDSAAVLEIWYTGDLLPRLMQQRSVGIDGVILAGDSGPVQSIAPGGTNLGSVPAGAWFAYLQDADPNQGEAILRLGRALGAPCAAMENGANRTNRSPGGPYFLKRFYVDGHEYNVVAVGTCSRTEFQYITLRAPLPKVPVTIEQHSVRLQPYGLQASLVLPPPFNYEHTILEDIRSFETFENIHIPPSLVPPILPRPQVRYMGGPIGPVAPILGAGDALPYAGRDPANPVGPYVDVRSIRWFYVDETTNPQMLGQLREKYGATRFALDAVFANSRQTNRVCVGDGAGGFSCSDVSPAPRVSTDVALGDVDGDGILDAVFANDNQPDQVCLGDGSGGFACANVSPDPRPSQGVALGDVNGDGDLDAIFATMNQPDRVCLGDGAGGFACGDVSADTNASEDVAIGDVNGDGDPDAVFANRGQTDRVCLGDGAGGFACGNVSADTRESLGVALGDLDGDGNLDAVFANFGQTDRVCVGDGAGGFACGNVSPATRDSTDVALGDMDDDGDLDAVFANAGQTDSVCRGDGAGGFSGCTAVSADIFSTSGVALGFVDGDGDLDAVFANTGQPNRICFGNGAGGFRACRNVSADARLSAAVALGDVDRQSTGPQDSFFYNEQIWTMPWHFTEFVLPDQPDPVGVPQAYDSDKYHVTSAFTAPTARWQRWTMPDAAVGASVPPDPPDLTVNMTPDGDRPLGAARRATFWFDPDDPAGQPVKLWTDQTGVRLFGGQPERPEFPCDQRRPAILSGAGDPRVATDSASVQLGLDYPVEVRPYTDPWAPFNPQHAHAPRGDSLTVNPAYMDKFRNFAEDLQALYGKLSNNRQDAREKVYHRLWYEPVYTSKIRFPNGCDRDVRFPALMQEFTYLFMDTTDNPLAAPPGRSQFGFPIGTGPQELPVPNPGGTLPAGGEFGFGLTNFDANFDGDPDAVTVHSEETLAAYLDAQWQSHRPTIPGFPLPPVPGPALDFDGDLITDTLNADTLPLNGNELVVFAVESVTLDLDPLTPAGSSAMMLDHLVTLENVTRGARAQFQFWFTGGNAGNARPERLGGVRSLEIGDAAIADRFRSRVTIVKPGEANGGTDGGWFVFLDDVARDDDRVTVTVGRALGATHSAIDNAAGNHDLLPGDPWYLKRFYVDGHEYNVVAIMTQPGPVGESDLFEYVTIRTPVPKGNVLNAQDSLFLQGYYLGALPDQVSVMPPFNVNHTIAVDIDRLLEGTFANSRLYSSCVGTLQAFGPLAETIVAEDTEPRLGVSFEELYRLTDDRLTDDRLTDDRLTWETDHSIVIPNQYTDVAVSRGQQYLFTGNWTSPVSRLHFYGCLRTVPPPFPPGVPGLSHEALGALAARWSPSAPRDIVPPPNQLNPPQPVPYVPPVEPPIIADYFDARLGRPDPRLKLFYDPAETTDVYFNRRQIAPPGPTPTATATRTGTPLTPTATSTSTSTSTPTPSSTGVVPTATVTRTPTPDSSGGGGAPTNVVCSVVAPYRIRVDWTDNSTFETEFIIEVSVEGSPYAPIDTVASTTMGSTGTAYNYTTPVDLAANTGYRFRVIARNPGTGETSPPSLPTAECRTQTLADNQVGCYKGKLYLQGRSNHGGTLIYVDGIPMGSTDSKGEFCICNLLPGKHTITTRGSCYLPAVAMDVLVGAGSTTVLPYTALRGGDVNNDNSINLFDLVRVGADYRSSPPNDPAADCALDNRVDLFDLVLVGSNYGVNGPMPWGYQFSALNGEEPAPVPADRDPVAMVATSHGNPDDPEVTLEARALADGNLAVDITAHQIRELYAAELRLNFDPKRLQVVDSSEAPGVQVAPGAPWEADGTSFIRPNLVDNVTGTILFAASRMNPAPPLEGDVVLVSITFRRLEGEPEGAYALSSVLLVDRWAREISARWEGVDITPDPDLARLTETIYLPYALKESP